MFVCCGEALIDMIPLQENTGQGANGQQGFVPLVGGAIFNTAIGLGRLGVSGGMLSGVSMDMFGQQLQSALQASQVNTDFLIRSSLPTTLAFVKLTDGHASYTFYDENSAGRSLVSEQMPHLPNKVSGLYFGGISLIAEPAADTYCLLAEQYAGSKLIMLDPNIRPSFVGDEKTYRQRLRRMLAVADLVKVSDEDLDWLVPGGADIPEKVLRLRQPANQWVLVTKGSAGSVAYGPNNQLVEQGGVKAEVVDTVGAGDTFNSGFLASLVEQNLATKAAVAQMTVAQISKALQLASQIAAVTVSRAGANPPWKQELV
ncbi:MAG TPA: carbohydrate kinase [Oceanospirillaceae bacterium]|nr:carbohydrate kinase [Oceanospirillaceae bacterium]